MQHLGMVASERKKQLEKMDAEMVCRRVYESRPDQSLEEIFEDMYKEVLTNG